MSNGKGKVDRDASASGSDKITILDNAIANISVIAHLSDNATMASDVTTRGNARSSKYRRSATYCGNKASRGIKLTHGMTHLLAITKVYISRIATRKY
jgi:hypothetical protein